MMKLDRIDGEWWIIDIPGGGNAGPYGTKQEANDDRIGLERFAKANEKLLCKPPMASST